jgi:GT2 family glycosyltransferase
MDISVIIVSYNTVDVLCKCIDSLHKYISQHSYEIIVVDNASEDGTQERLKSDYKSVHLIENSNNDGFAKAVNIGLKRAEGKVLGLINSDVIFIEDVFKKVIDMFEKNQEAGMIGCKLLNHDMTIQKSAYWNYPGLLEEVIEYGGFSDLVNRTSLPFRFSLSVDEHTKDQEVAHLKGACLFLRRETFERVGFLDERFFMYREETDYCKRIHDKGWKILFLSTASVIHLHKVSSDKLQDKGIKYRLSSHYLYLLKHRGHLEASLLYVIILFTSLARCLIIKLKGGDSRYYTDIVKWHLGLRNI